MAECLPGTTAAPSGSPHETPELGGATGGGQVRKEGGGQEDAPPPDLWYLRVLAGSGPRPNPHQIIRQIIKGPQAGPIIWKGNPHTDPRFSILGRKLGRDNSIFFGEIM